MYVSRGIFIIIITIKRGHLCITLLLYYLAVYWVDSDELVVVIYNKRDLRIVVPGKFSASAFTLGVSLSNDVCHSTSIGSRLRFRRHFANTLFTFNGTQWPWATFWSCVWKFDKITAETYGICRRENKQNVSFITYYKNRLYMFSKLYCVLVMFERAWVKIIYSFMISKIYNIRKIRFRQTS